MRMRWLASRIALLGVMGSLGACASAPQQLEGFAPPVTYAEAIAALEAGDQIEGRAKLAQVLEVCGTTALGERAAVALIADLSRAYLSQPYRTPLAEQFATSAYLVSLDVGGSLDGSLSILPSADPAEFPAECRSGSPSPTNRGVMVIPELPSQSMADRLAELESSVEALQTELARVRETLRP